MIKVTLVFFFALASLTVTPCLAGGDIFKNYAGHFEGVLTTHTGEAFSRQPVKCDIVPSHDNSNTLAIQDEAGSTVTALRFSKIGGKGFVVEGSFVESGLRAEKDKDQNKDHGKDHGTDQNCYADRERKFDLCFYRDLITLDVQDRDNAPLYSLTLNKFAVEKPTVKEAPQVYTLKQAIDRAWKLNFDNRIEFEHVMQAKYRARAAKLNLLPHISFGTILGNLTPTFLSVIGSSGDLLPFLFPTRWIQAKLNKNLSEAELDAMTLIRLDTAAQTEALFYSYENDRSIKELYADVLTRSETIRKAIHDREVLGLLPPGSTDNMNSVINFVTQSYTVMDALIKEDRAAISQVMGFYSPKAVSDVDLGVDDRPVSAAQPLDADAVTGLVTGRSVELRQLDFLIASAKGSKKMAIWNWLDPSGDPSMNLGFNLKSSVNAAASQVLEMQIRRDQMRQMLAQKVFNAVTDYNQSLVTYKVVADGEEIQRRRLDQIDRQLRAKGKIDLFNLVSVFQDYLTAGVNGQINLLTYRSSRARLDRLMLQGFYEGGTKPPQIKRQP